jgi:hypothetical protein
MSYFDDEDWQEPGVLTEVRRHATEQGDYYDFLFREFNEEGRGSSGIAVAVAEFNSAGLPEPKPGDVIALCGSLGRPIRGMSINSRRVFYRTPAEEWLRHQQEVERHRAERFAEYESKRDEMQRRVDALLPEFRARVEKFRRNNPDFGPEFESYELNCCENAQRVIAVYATADEVAAYHRLDWTEQKAAVPEITDGQSGNSFGMICRLAWLYRKDPSLVVQEHGALCPLVGCEQYGCFSAQELAAMKGEG